MTNLATQTHERLEIARQIAHSVCACMPYVGMEYEVAQEAALIALDSREVPAEIFETAFVLVQLGRSATAQDIRSVGQWILDTAPRVKVSCPYCQSAGTGLPGNACENCMNTGVQS